MSLASSVTERILDRIDRTPPAALLALGLGFGWFGGAALIAAASLVDFCAALACRL